MSSIGANSPEVGPESLLLWVDCEFTGLPIEQGHKVIEIGAAVTSLALNELETYESFVNYDWPMIEGLMDTNPWWDNKTSEREVMRGGVALGKPIAVVDADLAIMVSEYFDDVKPPVCGNSVRNDLAHIEAEMPLFASLLHYQIVDVSSLKIIAKKFKGIEYGQKLHPHHPLEDIRESIDELHFLLKQLGISDIKRILPS